MKLKRTVPWCECVGDKDASRKSWSYDPKQGTHVHGDCRKPSRACWKTLEENDLHPR